MNFQHWTLNLDTGDTVALTIDRQCDVFLVDDSNFSSFRSGRGFRYSGGAQKLKSVRITAPHSGHWHLVLIPAPGNTVHFSNPVVL